MSEAAAVLQVVITIFVAVYLAVGTRRKTESEIMEKANKIAADTLDRMADRMERLERENERIDVLETDNKALKRELAQVKSDCAENKARMTTELEMWAGRVAGLTEKIHQLQAEVDRSVQQTTDDLASRHLPGD